MTDIFAFQEVHGFKLKLWRGESMCLLGFFGPIRAFSTADADKAREWITEP